jgi:hypothetical protein
LQKINTKNGESQPTLGALLVSKHDYIYQSKKQLSSNDSPLTAFILFIQFFHFLLDRKEWIENRKVMRN